MKVAMDFDRQRYEEIFKRCDCTGEAGATLLLRLQLLLTIKDEISNRQWSQQEAAKVLGIKQPRVSEIFASRIDKFSIELLVKYLYRLQRQVELNVPQVSTAEVRNT